MQCWQILSCILHSIEWIQLYFFNNRSTIYIYTSLSPFPFFSFYFFLCCHCSCTICYKGFIIFKFSFISLTGFFNSLLTVNYFSLHQIVIELIQILCFILDLCCARAVHSISLWVKWNIWAHRNLLVSYNIFRNL